MKNDNVNFSVSDQYVQASHNFGSTSYYNVNTNTSTTVPWGTIDWVYKILGIPFSMFIWGVIIYATGHFFKVW